MRASGPYTYKDNSVYIVYVVQVKLPKCFSPFELQYERVVEPLMLDPSSAESVAAAAAATASDPRMQMDNAMLMPYQVQTISCHLL